MGRFVERVPALVDASTGSGGGLIDASSVEVGLEVV